LHEQLPQLGRERSVDFVPGSGKWVNNMRMRCALLLVVAATTAQAADTSTGSGVVIGGQGEILTNSHVIEDCQSITVQSPSNKSDTATVVARDQKNDLALVRIGKPSASIAAFREGSAVRAGESIVALGYPLSGLLASTASLSVGNVSALAGLGDDPRYFQISAPVQPGNSGGPLLDASGHLIGVVTGKLNAARIARVTGDIPQNVNFALKAEVARSFLDGKGIAYQKAASDQQLSAADVGDVARPFTVYIRCERTKTPGMAGIAPPEPPQTSPPPPSTSSRLAVLEADQMTRRGEAALAKKDFPEAMRSFRGAADKGGAAAMNRLGLMHLRGEGTAKNFASAMSWFKAAADKRNTDAMNNLAVMYLQGAGTARDLAQAASLFRTAASEGNATAMDHLGEMYAKGLELSKDCQAARQWLEKSLAGGNKAAGQHLQSGFEGNCQW
jgi:hypothetical protein